MLIVVSGCSNSGAEVSGKIYFTSTNFKKAKDIKNNANMGICSYEKGKVKKLFHLKRDPHVSEAGGKIAYRDVGSKKTFKILDLKTKNETQYHTAHLVSKLCLLDKTPNVLIYVGWDIVNDPVKGKYIQRDIYFYDLESGKETNITKYFDDNTIYNISTTRNEEMLLFCIIRKINNQEKSSIVLMNLKDNSTKTLPFSSTNATLSPDGKKVYIWGVHENVKGNRFYIYDLETETYQEFPKEGEYLWEDEYTFSPDGTKVVYIRWEDNGKKSLWVMDADRSNQKKLFEWGYMIRDLSWVE